jgi:8-oxo-dGTP diphosphatase
MKGQAPLPSCPIAAVIAVVIHDGQTLLVRRANPPDAGLWGFPGGKIEYGETAEAAALRELLEETSVQGEACGVITALDVIDRSEEGDVRHHYILVAVRCRWLSGRPCAGDDALEARWFKIAELARHEIPMSEDVEILARHAENLAFDDQASRRPT